MRGYDNLLHNHQILLDLPFREASGLITHDVSKPHHIASLAGHAPAWSEVALSGLGILEFGAGLHRYLEIPGADTVDLDFTGDFSLAAWIYPVYTAQPMVIMCRNTTDVCGWCMFLFNNPTYGPLLSLRTSQGPLAGDHTECWATGFTDSEWQLVGYSRDQAGLTATCYRNGKPVTTVLGATGMLDPTACGAANKLLIGVQEGEGSGYYEGKMWRPKAWPRKTPAEEWLEMYESKNHWFGS